MTKRHRREENLAAAVEMSAYDLHEIDEAPSQITITAAIECPSLSDLRPRASQILSSGKSMVSFACNRKVVTT